MTDEQINAAIAEACGWTNISGKAGRAPNADYVGSEFLPNYCADLNAMHEAEKGLSSEQEKDYFANIKVTVGDHIWYRTVGRSYRATARQRAEAFLRTIGKWKEVRND